MLKSQDDKKNVIKMDKKRCQRSKQRLTRLRNYSRDEATSREQDQAETRKTAE